MQMKKMMHAKVLAVFNFKAELNLPDNSNPSVCSSQRSSSMAGSPDLEAWKGGNI